MEENRPQWSSQLGFLLATIGSAVGLGNIWRFPYIMGQNGGAVFLLVYLILIMTICFIPLVCELSIGKFTKKENLGAYKSINKNFSFIGWLNIIIAVMVASFYFIVGGWIINYIHLGIINKKLTDYSQYFSNFTAESFIPCFLAILFLFFCIFFVFNGVNKGIEKANKIMMPSFALILITLAVFSLTLPNAQAGLEYMFKPDLSKFNFSMILAALGQALFSLSIGVGSLIVYGSYMKEKENITKNAYVIIFSDTTFALLAGIMIFPAVFAFNMEPNSGAGLVFVTLPQIFAQIPCGNIISVLFFVLLLFAALTSGISLIEVPVSALIENLKLSRQKASAIVFTIIALIIIPLSLSFGVLSDFKLFSKTLFDLFDFIASNILMPLSTLFLCVVCGWFFNLKAKGLFKNKFLSECFNISLKYFIPIILIGLLITGLK